MGISIEKYTIFGHDVRGFVTVSHTSSEHSLSWQRVTNSVATMPGLSLNGHRNAISCSFSRYKWNVRRLVSIACCLWIHSYSPNLESNVPSWSQRNFIVNRGPISWSRAFYKYMRTHTLSHTHHENISREQNAAHESSCGCRHRHSMNESIRMFDVKKKNLMQEGRSPTYDRSIQPSSNENQDTKIRMMIIILHHTHAYRTCPCASNM